MGRHVVKREDSAEDAEATDAVENDAARSRVVGGGASGMPVDPNVESKVIHGLSNVMPAEAREGSPPETPRKMYEVIAAPAQVVYEGCVMKVAVGKVYPEHSVDLDLLRRQGVRFRELTEAAAAMPTS